MRRLCPVALVAGCLPADSPDTGADAGCLVAEASHEGGDALIYDLAWSPVDHLLATGGLHSLRLLSVDPNSHQPTLLDEVQNEDRFNSVIWTADGAHLIAPTGPHVRIYRPVDGVLGAPHVGETLAGELQRAALSPDEGRLLTCDRDGRTSLHRVDFSVPSIERLASVPVHSRCTRVAFSPSGSLAMSAGLEGKLVLYRVGRDTLEVADTIQALEETAEAIFGATDAAGVAGSFGQINDMWTLAIDPQAASFEITDRWLGHASGVGSLQFDRDFGRLLSGGHDHRLHIWDHQDGAFAHTYSFPDDGVGVHSARWSPDESMVARTASTLDRLDILSVHDCDPG